MNALLLFCLIGPLAILLADGLGLSFMILLLRIVKEE